MKITKKMREEIQNYPCPAAKPNIPKKLKLLKLIKSWDAGAVFEVDLDWDYENHIFSSKEVMADFKKYVEKWPGIKKFKITKTPKVKIKFVR